MSAALLEWMDQALKRAQRQYGHANDAFTAHQALWEVDTLEAWRQANPADDVSLVTQFIHPLTLRLRRQYDHVRQSQDHRLIEWQLGRLEAWTRETHDLTPGATPETITPRGRSRRP